MQNNLITAEKIIESFNTWKFKREQPFDIGKFTEVIELAIANNSPIPFITYWGIGDKNDNIDSELQTFDFLRLFFQRIKDVYTPGITLTVIFTDNHGYLNGYSEDKITNYFSLIKDIVDKEDYRIVRLSSFVEYNKSLLEQEITHVRIGQKLAESLLNSSQKHYKASADAAYGMKLYYVQNQIEKRVLEDKFKNHVFLTFNNSEMNDLFPIELPIFYMYSLHTKTSVKPWFE